MREETLKRTMRRLLEEVWNRQQLDILPEVFTEGAVMHHGGSEEWGGHDMYGISEFRDGYMIPTQRAFPDIYHEAEEVLVLGDRVVMRFHGRGTHRKSFMGVEATHRVIRYQGIALFRTEGERIAEVWVYSNFVRQFAALI